MYRRLRTLFAMIAAAAVLAGLFFAYLRPSFVVDLANRIVLCF